MARYDCAQTCFGISGLPETARDLLATAEELSCGAALLSQATGAGSLSPTSANSFKSRDLDLYVPTTGNQDTSNVEQHPSHFGLAFHSGLLQHLTAPKNT